MTALATGQEVHGVVMGVRTHGKEGTVWLRVNAIPQFRRGEDMPYQVCTILEAAPSPRGMGGERAEGASPPEIGKTRFSAPPGEAQ